MANFWDADPVAGPPNSSIPRGMRNNNPLNIEAGQFTASQPGFTGSDGRFARFETPDQGFSAAEHLLASYGGRGINTVAGVINRWAPASDNNPVNAYASSVAGELGIRPNDRIDLGDPQIRSRLADAMARFENGQQVPRSALGFSGQPRPRNNLPPMIATGHAAPQQAASLSQDSGNWWDADPVADQQQTPQTATPSTSGRPRVVIDTNKIGQSEQQPTGGGQDRGVLDATVRGAAQGLTANFGDEIRGLVEASGVNPNDPASVYKLISGALQYFGGDAEAKKRYDEATARERGLNTAAEEQHPVASTLGGIGGAMALPLGVAAQGATLPARMGLGAATGAAIGGASGAGEGQGALDRTSRAITGAGIGGALGVAAPAAIEGIVRGGRAIATPIANAVRGVRDVDSEAARRVVTALQRDQAIDPAATGRLTPAEFAGSVQSGGPANLMDLGGETTRALARSAANTSPEGRAVLNRGINDRFEGQTDRVTGWMRNAFHFPDAGAQSKALDDVAKTVNKPAYAKAYAQGRAGIWDDELSELSQAPIVQDAVKAATKQAQNKSAGPSASVSRWVNNGKPTLEFWDLVKRQIDQEINVARRAGRNEDVATLSEVKNTIVSKIDDAVPSYAQARAGAAQFFGAQDALEAGQKFVTAKMANADARRALAQMSPTERQLFQDGFVSRFVETLNQTGDRRSILNKIAESPAAREKLNIALGPQRAAELEAGLRVEGIMDLARNAVQGNSTTARQLVELGLASGTYGFSGGSYNPLSNPSALINAAIVYGAARGKGAINERLSRRVAEMLASNDPRILLQGIRTVTRNQNLFNSLRAADRGLARVGGEQAPSSVLPAVGIGRTDDDPDVPRKRDE